MAEARHGGRQLLLLLHVEGGDLAQLSAQRGVKRGAARVCGSDGKQGQVVAVSRRQRGCWAAGGSPA